MKKFLLPSLFALMFTTVLQGQAPWNNIYDTPLPNSNQMGQLEGNEIIWRGDHILSFSDGTSCDFCTTRTAIFFRKLDLEGNLIDYEVFKDTVNLVGYRLDGHLATRDLVIENEDGNIVLIAEQLQYTSDQFFTIASRNKVMIHLDENFQVISLDTLNDLSTSDQDLHIVESIIERDSGYLVGGYIDDPDVYPSARSFLAELDKNSGEALWLETYVVSRGITDLQLDQDGSIYASGKKYGGSATDAMLMKFNSQGELIKHQSFGGPFAESGTKLLIDDDRFVVGGIFSQEEEDEAVFYGMRVLEETENSFEVVNAMNYGQGQTFTLDYGAFDVPDEEGYYLFGSYQETGIFLRSGMLFKVDENLDSLWSRRYRYFDSIDSDHHLQYMSLVPDGGFLGSGYIEQGQGEPNYGVRTLWLFRTDEYGCLEPGCQDVNVDEILVGLENVMSVYPNPATDFVTVKFDFPAGYSPPNSGEFRLMSMNGKEVLRKEVSPGVFDSPLRMDVSNLKAGVYVLHWTDRTRWFDSVRIIKN